MAYAFVSFATTLTEEGDDNNHGFKDTILLGLLTTASVSVNLVIMGLLVSFLKLFCVPIFVVVGFLSTGSWNFEDRKTAKETILNGLTGKISYTRIKNESILKIQSINNF